VAAGVLQLSAATASAWVVSERRFVVSGSGGGSCGELQRAAGVVFVVSDQSALHRSAAWLLGSVTCYALTWWGECGSAYDVLRAEGAQISAA
jgi:hypothetical protein